MQFSANSSWAEFRELGLERTAQMLGAVDDTCGVVAAAKALDAATLSDAFTALDADHSPDAVHVLMWCVLHMWDEMPDFARDIAVASVARNNPTAACYLYMHAPGLTEAHDAVLYQSWSPVMPNMRDRIASGAAVRAKGR